MKISRIKLLGVLIALSVAGTCVAAIFISLESHKEMEVLADKKEVHVFHGGDIQEGIEQAVDSGFKTVVVHQGVYKPKRYWQALIWLNSRHDGVRLLAKGRVILSARNKELANFKDPSFPAMVNHVVYFGDGVSSKTLIRGFEIEGARALITKKGNYVVEPNVNFERRVIFFADGGAIKVAGNSAPVIENVVISNNEVALCGAGISIEQRGMAQEPVRIKNSVFKYNKAPLTGVAIDLLPGSQAVVENSLFYKNKVVTPKPYYLKLKEASLWRRLYRKRGIFYNSSAVTVFRGSRLKLKNSTFVDNSNAVDYIGEIGWYEKRTPADLLFPSKIEISKSLFFNNKKDFGKIGYDIKASFDGVESVLTDNLYPKNLSFDVSWKAVGEEYEDYGYNHKRSEF